MEILPIRRFNAPQVYRVITQLSIFYHIKFNTKSTIAFRRAQKPTRHNANVCFTTSNLKYIFLLFKIKSPANLLRVTGAHHHQGMAAAFSLNSSTEIPASSAASSAVILDFLNNDKAASSFPSFLPSIIPAFLPCSSTSINV